MDLNGLREALRKEPFEPFIIRLADGRSLTVSHPEFLAVGQRRAVLIQEDDSCIWLEPLLVSSVEWPGPKRKPPRDNGSSKKRPRD